MLHFIKFTYSSDPCILFKPENCIHYISTDFLDSPGHLKWGLLQSRVMVLLSPILIEPKLLCVVKAALTLANVSQGWFHRHRCQRCPMSLMDRLQRLQFAGAGKFKGASEVAVRESVKWGASMAALGCCGLGHGAEALFGPGNLSQTSPFGRLNSKLRLGASCRVGSQGSFFGWRQLSWDPAPGKRQKKSLPSWRLDHNGQPWIDPCTHIWWS